MTNKKIDEIKAEIEEIKSKINSKRLSPNEIQIMNDTIAEKRREIEKLSKTEKFITPIIGAPTIGEKTNEPLDRLERENRFII